MKKFLNESGHLVFVNCTGIILVEVLEHRLESGVVEFGSLGHIVEDIDDESLSLYEVKSPRSIKIILIPDAIDESLHIKFFRFFFLNIFNLLFGNLVILVNLGVQKGIGILRLIHAILLNLRAILWQKLLIWDCLLLVWFINNVIVLIFGTKDQTLLLLNWLRNCIGQLLLIIFGKIFRRMEVFLLRYDILLNWAGFSRLLVKMVKPNERSLPFTTALFSLRQFFVKSFLLFCLFPAHLRLLFLLVLFSEGMLFFVLIFILRHITNLLVWVAA